MKCATCTTLFVRELPSPDAAFDYKAYYRAENLAIPEYVRARVVQLVRQFEPWKQQGALFDLGFGAGAFLDGALSLGWRTAGIEASLPPVEHARARGHDARLLSELNSFGAGQFDVVVATEVLEHVEHPEQVLASASRLLRPQGLLFVTTPAGDGLNGRVLGARWSVMAPPEHLALFSRRGLVQLLSGTGFELVESSTTGINPFELVAAAKQKVRPAQATTSTGAVRELSSATINELAMSNPVTAFVKRAVNGVLSVTGLGDTHQVFAEKR